MNLPRRFSIYIYDFTSFFASHLFTYNHRSYTTTISYVQTLTRVCTIKKGPGLHRNLFHYS
ncbi:hypothetical protein SAMN04488505_103358 [Chitinophaga rupis]|uniref:Uncharacterized protein n=1 Tax=Chitinophaga rupis TaxID=573321 RepID=A0A1H7VLA2_9BACT|nr:hypothetical protein SAMN04488505_103358 [Chitinophaga rupis]